MRKVYVKKKGEQEEKILLVSHLEVADTFCKRLIGLMFRAHIPEGAGMWITPCKSIHTMFCRFPMDIAFVQKDGSVIHTLDEFPSWRISKYFPKSSGVLEAPAGTFKKMGLEVGNQLIME